jgi:hypothetical protein
MCEELRQSFQRLVQILSPGGFHHANYLDCFGRAFSARRRGLGVFSLAALSAWINARFDEHRAALQTRHCNYLTCRW